MKMKIERPLLGRNKTVWQSNCHISFYYKSDHNSEQETYGTSSKVFRFTHGVIFFVCLVLFLLQVRLVWMTSACSGMRNYSKTPPDSSPPAVKEPISKQSPDESLSGLFKTVSTALTLEIYVYALLVRQILHNALLKHPSQPPPQ